MTTMMILMMTLHMREEGEEGRVVVLVLAIRRN